MTEVEVTTGSRVHFGLLCGPPMSKWHYGGIGLMLNQPAWDFKITLNRESDQDIIATSPAVAARAKNLLGQFRSTRPHLPPVRIVARKEVDFHTGLGSGTQLTLALGTACLLLSGEPRPASVEQLAERLGRSRRSAIGTYGFDRGGFIVDMGRSENVLHRYSFPEEWRMVLLTPATITGLSGATEEEFFGKRDFLSRQTVEAFDALIRTEIIPSLEQSDFQRFRHALGEYGNSVGQDYAAAQGGIFSNELVRSITSALAENGVSGAVQSSWGPTVCIPAACEHDAQNMRRMIRNGSPDDAMNVVIASGLNTGATVKTVSPEDYRTFG